VSQPVTDADTTILHVCESFGGGLGEAIRNYVHNTPEFAHHLLYTLRAEATVTAAGLTGFEGVRTLPTGHLARVAAVRRAVRELSASVVHAHSSYAGVYVRLAVRADSAHRVVYTPHCYAFERRDVASIARAGFRFAEWVLSANTSVVAGCSQREAALSRWPLSRARTVFVPNVVSIDSRPPRVLSSGERGQLTVVGAGRLCPQKDPKFFIAAVRALRERGITINPVWIGGGAPDLEAEMASIGIRVTGWLDRGGVLKELGQADLYLHTAAWEGFPIAVLEADALGVATVVRRIPALEEIAAPASIVRPEELAERWQEFASAASRISLIAAMRAALVGYDDKSQREALLHAWGVLDRGTGG
jgi:glycosyltransferase involved in cell wall biosynthesis